MLNKH